MLTVEQLENLLKNHKHKGDMTSVLVDYLIKTSPDYAAGDVFYADSNKTIQRLAKDAGKFLKSGASAPSWAFASESGHAHVEADITDLDHIDAVHRALTNNPHTTTDANLSTSDITTNNVSTSKHGFAPKGDGSTTTFLNANGAYSTPSAGIWTHIATTTLGSSAATIAFSSIASGYTSFRITAHIRMTQDEPPAMYFNADTGNNYSYNIDSNNKATSASAIWIGPSSGVAYVWDVNPYSIIEITIQNRNYEKTCLYRGCLSVSVPTTEPMFWTGSGFWDDVSEISTITFDGVGAADFNTGTKIILEGTTQ